MVHKLIIDSLSHSFGKKAVLSNVHLEIATGNITGILGRNGSGKTTLFKTVIGTLKPSSLHAYLDGEIIQNNTDLYRFIGFHPQEIILPQGVLVSKLITMYILNGDDQNKIFYAPGVYDMQSKRVYQLSHGQQRYLQFLLILNLKHSFIFLDEPFSMVEPIYRSFIKDKLVEYKNDKGIIITDHYYLDILDVSDKIYLIKNGEISPINKPEDLISNGYLADKSILF